MSRSGSANSDVSKRPARSSMTGNATVSLITSAVGAISKDKKLSRAEALRRAMLTMIDKGKPHEAHPTYWAPFVVVGEGGAVPTQDDKTTLVPRKSKEKESWAAEFWKQRN
jgi:hypothetical protein